MFEDASFGLASLKKQKLDKLTKEPFLIFEVCFKLYFGQKPQNFACYTFKHWLVFIISRYEYVWSDPLIS